MTLIFAYAIAGMVGAGTGFATRSTFDNDMTEDRIVTTPGQAAALATVTGSSSAWAIIAAGFTPR